MATLSKKQSVDSFRDLEKTAKKKKESDTSVDSLENSNFLFDIDVEEV